MTGSVRISDRDVHALLRIVTGEREHDVAEGLPLSLLGDLNEQIPCDALSFFGLNSRQETAWFGQDLPAGGGQDDQAFWAHYWDSEPCSYPDDHDLGFLQFAAMARHRHVPRLPAVGRARDHGVPARRARAERAPGLLPWFRAGFLRT
jgi:hypothetical protein